MILEKTKEKINEKKEKLGKLKKKFEKKRGRITVDYYCNPQ
jgi:peptidoglycan hydrolase CwlO-like protein